MSPATLHALLAGYAFLLGLVVGSFLNVCIARMPEDRSVIRPPSHCPVCGHRIRWFDNVPVLSWLLLRGRCRDCGTPISSIYPAVELLTGLLGWLLFRRIVPDAEAIDLAHLAAWLTMFLFVAMLVAQTFIDVRHYIIPDEFSIYAVPLGVAASALLQRLGWSEAIGWKASVLGALAGGGFLLLVMGLFWLVRRREGMGLGDVKLLAMIGSFLGPFPAVPFVLFVASVAGSLVGVPLVLLRRRGLATALPFGPFLAFAAVLYVLHGPAIVERWLPGWRLIIR